MWWQTRCPGRPAAAVRSLPRVAQFAQTGETRTKLNCKPHRAGSDLQWRHFQRYGDHGGGRLRRPHCPQGACPLTQRAASSTSLQVEKRVVGSVELLCDVSRGGVRPLVPLVDRPAVFAAFHGLAHAGTRATKRIIAARVM
jgi:hypothetical protein